MRTAVWRDDLGGEGEFLVVAGRGLVATFDLDHDEEDAVPLQVGVAVALGAEQLDAAHLEILEVAAVMEVAHGVDFGVADAEGEGVLGHAHWTRGDLNASRAGSS